MEELIEKNMGLVLSIVNKFIIRNSGVLLKAPEFNHENECK